MKAIDSHFHLYKNAQVGILAQGGESRIGFSGTYEEAVSIMNRNEITGVIALAVIPIEPMRRASIKKWPDDLNDTQRLKLRTELEDKIQSRISSYNEWLCRIAKEDPRIEPAIHADATVDCNYMADEIQSKIDMYRIKVLKIHPAANFLTPEHENYQKIFDLAQENNLVVISHGGILGDDFKNNFCPPDKFIKALDNFPKLKVVIAHLAYPDIKNLCELAARYKNLYTDISMVVKKAPLANEDFQDIIKAFGPDRILFGSDFPWSDPEKDAQKLSAFHIDKNDLEMIARENAIRLFQLT